MTPAIPVGLPPLNKATATMMMCTKFGYCAMHYLQNGIWWCSACCTFEEPQKPETERQAAEIENDAKWLGTE